jgi:hypothetical protein
VFSSNKTSSMFKNCNDMTLVKETKNFREILKERQKIEYKPIVTIAVYLLKDKKSRIEKKFLMQVQLNKYK